MPTHRVRTKTPDIFESQGVMFTASEQSQYDEKFNVNHGWEFKDWFKTVTSSEESKLHNHVFFVKRSPVTEKCFPCFEMVPPAAFTVKHNVEKLQCPEKYKEREFQARCMLCALDGDRAQKGCSMALVTRTLTSKDKSVDSLKTLADTKKFFAFSLCSPHANQVDDSCDVVLIKIVRQCMKLHSDALVDSLVFRNHSDVFIKDIPKRTLKPALELVTSEKEAAEQSEEKVEVMSSSSEDEDEEEDKEEDEEEDEDENGDEKSDIFSALAEKQNKMRGDNQQQAPKKAAENDKPQDASKKDKPQDAPKKDKPQDAPKKAIENDKPQDAPKKDKPQDAPKKAIEKDKPQEATNEKSMQIQEGPSASGSKDCEMLENALKVIMGMKDKLNDNSVLQEKEALIKENGELKRKLEQVTQEHNKLQKVTDSMIQNSDMMSSFLRAKYRQSLEHNKALKAHLELCDEKLSAFQHVAQDLDKFRDSIGQSK